MTAHTKILAVLTGVVVVVAVEGWQAARVAHLAKRDGITLNAPVLGRVKLTAPAGGGDTFELPASARAVESSMHLYAALAGIIAVGAVIALEKR